MGARDQRSIQQSLGFLLVRTDYRRFRLQAVEQRIAIRIQQSLYLLLVRKIEKMIVVMRRHAGRDAAADHEPCRLVQLARN